MPSSSNAALLDPRRLAAGIASLAQSTPQAALARIEAWLMGLRPHAQDNAGGLGAVLPLIDASVRAHYRHATRHFLQNGPGLGAGERQRLFEIVDSCLARLADIEQLLAVHALRGAAQPAPSASIFMSAVRVCAARRKWSRLLQQDLRPGVWADLCRLYAEALAAGWANTPIPATPGSAHTTSVEREWLKACAFAAIEDGMRLPGPLDVAERAIEFCADQFVASAQPDPRLAFAVDLESGELSIAVDAIGISADRVRHFGLAGRKLRELLERVNIGRLDPGILGHAGRREVVETLAFLAARLEKR